MINILKRYLKICVSSLYKPLFYTGAVVLLLSAVYHFYYAKKIIPGVRLSGIEVGGLTYTQALEKVAQKEVWTAGLQFHLESTPASVKKLLDNCADELVPGPYIQTPAEVLAPGHFFLEIEKIMNKFLQNMAQQA